MHDVGKLSKAELNIDYWLIPLILTLMSACILLLSIPLTKSILFYITGLSLAATPANAGQVVKSYTIKKQFGHSISKTSPIVLVEKWNELISVLIILIVFDIINSVLESTLIIIIGIAIALFLFGIMRNHTFFMLFKKIILKFHKRLKTPIF
jgi:hypothetical protein